MMFWRKRDRKKRLTSIGGSLTGVSMNWEVVRTDRARAREVLHRLEDHRMLYDPYEAEYVEQVVESAERLRSYLGEQIPQCETVELRDHLRKIQAAVRALLTNLDSRRARRRNEGPWRVVGRLRVGVGSAVEDISHVFELPVDGDLLRIVEEGRRASTWTS